MYFCSTFINSSILVHLTTRTPHLTLSHWCSVHFFNIYWLIPFIINHFYILCYKAIHTHKFIPIPITDRHGMITSIHSCTFDYRITETWPETTTICLNMRWHLINCNELPNVAKYLYHQTSNKHSLHIQVCRQRCEKHINTSFVIINWQVMDLETGYQLSRRFNYTVSLQEKHVSIHWPSGQHDHTNGPYQLFTYLESL